MIHKSGIYVIESKNYSGWIQGHEEEKGWIQTFKNGKIYKESRFLNPIMQNKLHLKYLKRILSEVPECHFHSIVAFSDHCSIKDVSLSSPEAIVIHRKNLKALVKKIAHRNETNFDNMQIDAIFNELYPYTQVSPEQIQKHIDDIMFHHSKSEEN